MQWWYVKDGQQVGPVRDTEFQRLVRLRTITDDSLVWHEGMANWLPFGQVTDDDLGKIKPKLRIAGTSTQKTACGQCGREFPAAELVQYGQQYVCAECKPEFFQRVQEGAPTPGGGVGATPNRDLMAHARQALAGRWGSAIGICVLVGLVGIALVIVGSIIPGAGLSQIFLMPPFMLGLTVFFLALVRQQDAQVGMLTSGFSRYWPSVGTSFLQQLIVNGVTLLAILPGGILMIVGVVTKNVALMVGGGVLMVPAIPAAIMAGYMFALSFFVLADDSTQGVLGSLRRSRALMAGMKWKFFCLNCRFFGWSLLCLLTCCIGFLWLIPYMYASHAAFYDDVRGRASA